jgi:hypothetical protein
MARNQAFRPLSEKNNQEQIHRSVLKAVIRNIVKKGRRTELLWRYGFNLIPSLSYKVRSNGSLKGCASNIVKDLNEDGIAVTTVEELFGRSDHFAEIASTATALLEERGEELRKRRCLANDKNSIGEKPFNVELLGSYINFDADDVFAKFAIQKEILSVANAYFCMLAKLRYYNVWLTFATDSELRESQLWHFDREDNYILKMFLYLSDVDDGAGPFTYAPKTHRKGKLRNVDPEHYFEGGVQRSTDEQLAAVVPEKDWIKAVGRKGTIVFADTRGFHKGGGARTTDRLMYTCMFTSAASDSKRLLRVTRPIQGGKLTDLQLAALEIS